MTIESAKFIVQRGADQFSCLGDQLKDKLQSGDLLVVQHNADDAASRYVWNNVDGIQDTDWLCCTDDDGVTYKVRGDRFKEVFVKIKKPVILTPYDGAGLGQIVYRPNTGKIVSVQPYGAGNIAEYTPGTCVWTSITYGNIFVSVAVSGVYFAMDSPDGEVFRGTSSPDNAGATEFESIAYGNGVYVAVGHLGKNQSGYVICVSTDGHNFTGTNGPDSGTWYDVTFGDGRFVAIAYDGSHRAMWSDDGYGWTLSQPVKLESWESVTYGDGKFVAVNSTSNEIMYSSDGDVWEYAIAPRNFWTSITYGNNRFVAVGKYGRYNIMYSDDGITWTETPQPEENYWNGVIYGDDKFVAVASSGDNRVMYSYDGITWEAAKAAKQYSWHSIAYGDGRFVAVARGGGDGSDRAMWSFKGTEWSSDMIKLNLKDQFARDQGSVITTIDKAFFPGDTVRMRTMGVIDQNVNGIVKETSADPAEPYMILRDVNGTWLGESLLGDTHVAVRDGELIDSGPSADEVSFTSSKAESESGTVKEWGNADWELATDQNFTSKQESSVPLSSDPDAAYEDGPTNFSIEDATEYFARVKYNNKDSSLVSEWSDTVHFKTK